MGVTWHRHLWQDRDEEMPMIFGDMPGDDDDIVLGADVTDEVTTTGANLASQGSPPIVRDPHQMVMDFVDHMRAVAIVTHASQSTRAPWRAC
jgi:hypothetical protein